MLSWKALSSAHNFGACTNVSCMQFLFPFLCNIVSGDALEAASFPYLYFSKFWFGCILRQVYVNNICIYCIELNVKVSLSLNVLSSALLFSMVACFCHHLSDNYVDLSDIYVDSLVIYVDLIDHYDDFSEKNHQN